MRWSIGQVHLILFVRRGSHFSVAFSSAVDWSERWIQCLLGFHIILFLAVIISRKNADLQTFLFLFIAVLVFLSETINSYCAIHWKEFSKQNYFDNQGVFIGILFAAPLLSICLFQLVSCLLFSSSSPPPRPLSSSSSSSSFPRPSPPSDSRTHLHHPHLQINFLSLASSALITFKRLEHKQKLNAKKKE
jgi:hypothetical protein